LRQLRPDIFFGERPSSQYMPGSFVWRPAGNPRAAYWLGRPDFLDRLGIGARQRARTTLYALTCVRFFFSKKKQKPPTLRQFFVKLGGTPFEPSEGNDFDRLAQPTRRAKSRTTIEAGLLAARMRRFSGRAGRACQAMQGRPTWSKGGEKSEICWCIRGDIDRPTGKFTLWAGKRALQAGGGKPRNASRRRNSWRQKRFPTEEGPRSQRCQSFDPALRARFLFQRGPNHQGDRGPGYRVAV